MSEMLTKTQTKRWQKWIKALKSGKYKQGEGALKTDDGGMCCLAVACDIVAPNDWVGGFHQEADKYPSDKVCNLMGFSNEQGFYINSFESIANINDASIPKARDYSNVLPYIEAEFEERRYREVKA